MIKSIIALLFLSLAVVFSSNAQDTDRIGQLEKEVKVLSARISALEARLSNHGNAKVLVPSVDGWKSVVNWRKLLTDMSHSDVRRLLGEPERIDGGSVAWWYYPNGGSVTFVSDRAIQWVEPKK